MVEIRAAQVNRYLEQLEDIKDTFEKGAFYNNIYLSSQNFNSIAHLKYQKTNILVEAPSYDGSYFEGQKENQLGYKNLSSQSNWRIEKAWRKY